MFTAFGYFDDTENQKVLDAGARALKPGGKFLIDLLNTLRVIRDFRPQSWDELFVQLPLLSPDREHRRTSHLIDPDGSVKFNSSGACISILS